MKKMEFPRKAQGFLASATLGILLAQGAVLLSASDVKADGTCSPAQDYICGLNGTNYNNKKFS